MPRLLGMSDIHVGHRLNRLVIEQLAAQPDDWLVVAGDVGDTFEQFEWALSTLAGKFARVVWVPGNHELWTLPRDPVQLRGEARYLALVDTCRRLGVVTPEDPYPTWDCGPGEPLTIAPLFTLYDYTFRPPGTGKDEALEASRRAGVVCADEYVLHPDPYPSREAWCHARVAHTEARLAAEVPPGRRTVLVDHFPLVRSVAVLPAIPTFTLWCGTELTADWHLRFRADVVVSGHLHIPKTRWVDGVRFEEVSLGYPRQWARGPARPPLLREILPGPEAAAA